MKLTEAEIAEIAAHAVEAFTAMFGRQPTIAEVAAMLEALALEAGGAE